MHHTKKKQSFFILTVRVEIYFRVTEKVTEINSFLSIIVNEFSYKTHTNRRSFDSVIH